MIALPCLALPCLALPCRGLRLPMSLSASASVSLFLRLCLIAPLPDPGLLLGLSCWSFRTSADATSSVAAKVLCRTPAVDGSRPGVDPVGIFRQYCFFVPGIRMHLDMRRELHLGRTASEFTPVSRVQLCDSLQHHTCTNKVF
ncbi:uncharacterized protein LY79DRAFT_585185 [Colletotrichum navitas]|uniref:Secreted protein n=1 Tax=Colletotrichum navitas TaxID=681940 RepID=A0AAD8PJB3_9PEZI|nr:uncharacterized protein LY79DRAFT_585185 [Colletotrichum navitas]KAK1565822.1 hypothetical protein LY79DRAFT_585185 [Colletotrichum navitas]